MKNNLAVNLAPSEIMKTFYVAGSFNHALTILRCFNRQQNMADSELLLESTKTNRSTKVLFTESSMASQMHSKHPKISDGNLF